MKQLQNDKLSGQCGHHIELGHGQAAAGGITVEELTDLVTGGMHDLSPSLQIRFGVTGSWARIEPVDLAVDQP